METYKSEADDKSLSKLEKVVVIDISSAWCGPCKALTPVLEALESEYIGKVKFVKVDVTDGPPQFVIDMGLKVVPTLLFYKDGVLKSTEVGYKNKQVIVDILSGLIG